ncbi:MAG TPA: histidine phosphatase family protein [Beijerinckiaceae bacterium]|jgi:broad specificity phosphatase PhoE
MMHRRRFLAGLAAVCPAAALAQAASNASALRALAEGGMVALIRHAAAPGTGDPPGFRLDDCSTQRNLSEAGRRQAAELGRMLRQAGVRVTDLRSSRWCRASQTAELAFPDIPVQRDPALDSFFDEPERQQQQTDQIRALMASWRGRDGALVLVTHQVNITAATGVYPAEGEIVVVQPTEADVAVLGRVRV